MNQELELGRAERVQQSDSLHQYLNSRANALYGKRIVEGGN